VISSLLLVATQSLWGEEKGKGDFMNSSLTQPFPATGRGGSIGIEIKQLARLVTCRIRVRF